MRAIEADICVIGAGSAGLSVAAGAAQLGRRTVLIEKHLMGGDCLNVGCVPSKALIAAAHAAHAQRNSGRFGVAPVEPKVDFQAVHDHVKGVIAGIAPTDSVARFRGLGVEVIEAEGRFAGPNEVVAGDARIRARRFVVATGSRPTLPPVKGLADVPTLTNETIFDLTERPRHLVVIGGGPIGLELAQAHRRLGAAVTVVERLDLMGKDDPEAVGFVARSLAHDGVRLLPRTEIDEVTREGDGIALAVRAPDGADRLVASHVLVAAGRKPNVEGLGLEAAGIAFGAKGIEVDKSLRTSNRRVYAIGDVAGGLQFTHVAGWHAGLVIRNALFRLPVNASDTRAIPWVTYTDPELAHVGLNEAQAAAKGPVRVLRWPLAENDRARASRELDGLAKIVTDARGRVLGATLVGPGAGELIAPWVLAVSKGLGVSAMASAVAPYPTLGEIGKRAAGSFYTPTLFSPRTRALVRLLSWFG
jgi:pyruvate/2-oxoglutarate dehydrogenase complex dihydrolipoamide dehydrogenase (E3) component